MPNMDPNVLRRATISFAIINIHTMHMIKESREKANLYFGGDSLIEVIQTIADKTNPRPTIKLQIGTGPKKIVKPNLI